MLLLNLVCLGHKEARIDFPFCFALKLKYIIGVGYVNSIVTTDLATGLNNWNLHPEAFSHGALVEGLRVHLDDDLVQGPRLGNGVVAVAGRFLGREVVQIETGPWVDPD